MKSRHGMVRLLAGSLLAGCLGLLAHPLEAAEQCQAFLNGLRERQFYDLALNYLEAMRTSPLADNAFRKVLDYEVGVTLVEGSRLVALKDREKQLDEARTRFQKFTADHPQHPLVLSANAHLSNLLVERGRIKTEQAALPAMMFDQKKQLLLEARGLFLDAQKMLAASDARLAEKRREYKFVAPKNTARIEHRDQIQRDILQTRITLASLSFEIGQTYEAGSKEYKDAISDAATLFGQTYRKYSPRLGAYYARIGEARCYKELGNYVKAFEAFDDLLAQGDDSEGFRNMRSKATALAMETALLPQVKKYKEALDRYRAWERTAQPHDQSSDEGLAIKCLGGEAALKCARDLNADDPSYAKQRSEYLNIARCLLTSGAQAPEKFQQWARVKLSDVQLEAARAEGAKPQTYEEARDRARSAWDQMQAPGLKEEEVARLRDEALMCFRFALAHPARDVKREELNTIRYCLAYLNWAADNWYEAAVLGEFLAHSYPDRPEAPQGARIALAAYAKLLANAAAGDDCTFESERMVRLARYITERWPNSPPQGEIYHEAH